MAECRTRMGALIFALPIQNRWITNRKITVSLSRLNLGRSQCDNIEKISDYSTRRFIGTEVELSQAINPKLGSLRLRNCNCSPIFTLFKETQLDLWIHMKGSPSKTLIIIKTTFSVCSPSLEHYLRNKNSQLHG